MSTFKCSTKLIGAAGLGLCLYALSIVQCASQTPDSIVIPKAGWERLQSAIDGVADAMRAIRSAPTPTPTQTIQSTSPSPSTAANQLAQDPDPPVTTSQVYLEGKWVTEWPKDTILIELGRVEDLRYHGGKLSPQYDGTYELTADHYSPCYYNIALSPDHNTMFWVPTNNTNKKPPPNAVLPVIGCRPATMFYLIRDCCGERDRDCCGERHRDRDCWGERHRDRDCWGERHRDRDCCGERHRDRDCCGERAIAYTRLADGDRTDTGHHLALRQVTVADDALVAVPGLQIGMLVEKVSDLGLDRLGEKGTGPVAQDFCELIVEDSWLNQLDDVIVGHGISLLWWRSGGVKHPHDMPPSRFPPSPTFGDSSPYSLSLRSIIAIRASLGMALSSTRSSSRMPISADVAPFPAS